MAQLAYREPQHNFLAVDIKDEVLIVAKRNIETAFAPQQPDNVRLMSWNIERLDAMLAKEDGIDGIYINFCNPWPKSKHRKHRLTYPRQLKLYAALMRPGAKLYFKTDDDSLFYDTQNYLREAGWKIQFISSDFLKKVLPEIFRRNMKKCFWMQGKQLKAWLQFRRKGRSRSHAVVDWIQWFTVGIAVRFRIGDSNWCNFTKKGYLDSQLGDTTAFLCCLRAVVGSDWSACMTERMIRWACHGKYGYRVAFEKYQ